MLRTLHNLKSEKGCTLVELMMIVTVIGILADITLPHFIAYIQRAYDGQALADARRFYKACIQATLETNVVVSYGGAVMPPGYDGLRPVQGMFAWNPKWPTLVFCNATFKHPKGRRVYNLNAKGYIDMM
jgi:type II secretory pathway pseudopilin PulG